MGENCEDLERELRRRIREFVSRSNPAVQSVVDTLKSLRVRGWTAFIFGGIPRGVFGQGRSYQPRDLDLVFDDEHFVCFESAFQHCILRRNNYGGLRLRMGDAAVDAWPLSATWAFREGLVKEASFERLPSTAFLNIDGIVVEAVPVPGRGRRVFEAGFFDGWNQRTLDINLEENPHPGICVARTLRISKRYGFKLSHRLCTYVWRVLSARTLEEVEGAEKSHYGRVVFGVAGFRDVRERLENHLAGGSRPAVLFPGAPEQVELRFDTDTGMRLEDSRWRVAAEQ